MNWNSAKTRSYLELLIALLAIMVILPVIEVKNDVINNIILSVFFLFFLLAALRVTITKGVAPHKLFYKRAIQGTIVLSFAADLAQSLLYTLFRNEGKLLSGVDPLLHLRGSILWIRLFDLVTVLGYAFLTLFLIIVIIRDLFSGTRVQVNKIFGAIVAYLLLGIFWAFLYSIFELIEPGAIVLADCKPITNFAQATYFSFVTLCTVGYGDIIPRTHLAMICANLESVAGQLYLAILVARLVSLYTANSSREKAEIDPAKPDETEEENN